MMPVNVSDTFYIPLACSVMTVALNCLYFNNYVMFNVVMVKVNSKVWLHSESRYYPNRRSRNI